MAPLTQLALFVTALAAMGGAPVSAESRGHSGAVTAAGRHLLAGPGPLMPPMPGGGVPQQQGQGMGPFPPMMPGGGGNGGMPPLPPGQKPAIAFTINATLSLAGLTVATFNNTAQNAFLSTLATTISVPPDAVAINSITATALPAGRRRQLLQSGVVIAFGVVSPFQALANQTAAAIVSATTGSGATAFVAALNTALTSAGAPTCTSMAVVSQAVVAAAGGPMPLAPPAPAAHKSGGSASPVRHTAFAAAAAALLAALLA